MPFLSRIWYSAHRSRNKNQTYFFSVPHFLTLFNFSLFNWLIDQAQSTLVVSFGILDLFCFLFGFELSALIELLFEHFVEFFIIVDLHQCHWFLLRPDEFAELFLLFFLTEVQTVWYSLDNEVRYFKLLLELSSLLPKIIQPNILNFLRTEYLGRRPGLSRSDRHPLIKIIRRVKHINPIPLRTRHK